VPITTFPIQLESKDPGVAIKTLVALDVDVTALRTKLLKLMDEAKQ